MAPILPVASNTASKPSAGISCSSGRTSAPRTRIAASSLSGLVSCSVTLAPPSLAHSAVPMPIGPMPTTSTVLLSSTDERATAWAPMARNSTIEAAIGLNPPAG